MRQFTKTINWISEQSLLYHVQFYRQKSVIQESRTVEIDNIVLIKNSAQCESEKKESEEETIERTS